MREVTCTQKYLLTAFGSFWTYLPVSDVSSCFLLPLLYFSQGFLVADSRIHFTLANSSQQEFEKGYRAHRTGWKYRPEAGFWDTRHGLSHLVPLER